MEGLEWDDSHSLGPQIAKVTLIESIAPCNPSEVWMAQTNSETTFEWSKGSESALSEHLSLGARPTHRNLVFPSLLHNYKYIISLKHESTLKFITQARYEFRGPGGKPFPFCFAYTVTQDTFTYTHTHTCSPHDYPGWQKTILRNRKKTDTSFPYLCLSCIWGSILFCLYWLFSVHRPGTALPEFAVSIAIGTPPAASKLESWGDRLHLSVQSCLQLRNPKAH